MWSSHAINETSNLMACENETNEEELKGKAKNKKESEDESENKVKTKWTKQKGSEILLVFIHLLILGK